MTHERDLFGGIEEATGGVEFRPKSGRLRPDDEIFADICARLREAPTLAGASVEVTVQANHVTLRGEVPNLDAKTIAANLAGGVRGVLGLHNELNVLDLEVALNE